MTSTNSPQPIKRFLWSPSFKSFLRFLSFVFLVLLALNIFSGLGAGASFIIFIPLILEMIVWSLTIENRIRIGETTLSIGWTFAFPVFLGLVVSIVLYILSTNLFPLLQLWAPALPLLLFGAVALLSAFVAFVKTGLDLIGTRDTTKERFSLCLRAFGIILMYAWLGVARRELEWLDMNGRSELAVIRNVAARMGLFAVGLMLLSIALQSEILTYLFGFSPSTNIISVSIIYSAMGLLAGVSFIVAFYLYGQVNKTPTLEGSLYVVRHADDSSGNKTMGSHRLAKLDLENRDDRQVELASLKGSSSRGIAFFPSRLPDVSEERGVNRPEETTSFLPGEEEKGFTTSKVVEEPNFYKHE